VIGISRLHELLAYEPDTGVLRWRVARGRYGNRLKAGTIAGGREPNGYIQVRVDDRLIRAHRIIWAMQYGYWPKTIDHINRDKGDNRLVNLREATISHNNANRDALPNGVRVLRGKYFQAAIGINGKVKYLGSFPSAEAARAAYIAAHKAHHGEFSNFG
jgi:hypothetical protein